REVAGDTLDLWIVEPVCRELVVGRDPMENGRLPEDEIGLVGSAGRRGGQDDESGSNAGGNGAQETLHSVSCDIGISGARRKTSRPQPFLLQILVNVGDLLAIAVVNQRRPALAGADDLFAGLAPARMRHRRVDVGPEAVFRRLQSFPQALGP